MSVNINQRKIYDLVGENHVYAAALHYLGINFFDYSEHTLSEVCKEKGLSIHNVVQTLEQAVLEKSDDLPLFTYPIELIVEYLKHMHYIFIKQKLPFLSKTIARLSASSGVDRQTVEDLQFVFPLFVEDFIKHIYEEEDTLFSYVQLLNNALEKNANYGRLYFAMENTSLHNFALEHEVHDDEMAGIRSITKDYSLKGINNTGIKVVYKTLQQFEKELQVHAAVENEILFPKAMMLEKQVKSFLKEKIASN